MTLNSRVPQVIKMSFRDCRGNDNLVQELHILEFESHHEAFITPFCISPLTIRFVCCCFCRRTSSWSWMKLWLENSELIFWISNITNHGRLWEIILKTWLYSHLLDARTSESYHSRCPRYRPAWRKYPLDVYFSWYPLGSPNHQTLSPSPCT